jgi:superfamily II DNA or RNA helicase
MSIQIHPLLSAKIYKSWEELESQIALIQDTTEKGDVFEQFSYYFFLYHAEIYQIKDIYSPKIPGRDIPRELCEEFKLSIKDDGVDGLIMTVDGKSIAYQAKFRSGRVSPSSNELNNFWSEAEYANFRLVISNAVSLPSDTHKRKNGLSVLIDKFMNLDKTFFRFLYDSIIKNTISDIRPKKLKPLPFQERILESIVEGFKRVDRGKVIAACASGKTLISLWASERLNSQSVLFFAPNLALIRQSLERWTQNANTDFIHLAVCSDSTISEGLEDQIEVKQSEIDLPVTTNPEDIISFLKLETSKKRVIVSTYQSVECIKEALSRLPGYKFDLVVYDEAHRTAGNKDSGLFSLALKEENIPAKKRFFMTATEKLVKPWIKEKFEQENRVILSMDDENIYGPTFYKLSFGEAIKERIIADYQIVVAGITNDEYSQLIKENRYLSSENEGIEEISAQLLFKFLLLATSVREVGAKKVVSFHSSIKEANNFVEVFKAAKPDFLEKFKIDTKDSAFLHVNGSQPSAIRQRYFKDFEKAQFGLLSNVRCLTEGVDIPYIDAILFADPKGSMIDIVQAVGRALRKPIDVKEKTSYIILPILIKKDGSYEDEELSSLHTVIQALRNQDETLAEWIDEINISVVKGRGKKGFRSNPKFKLILPKNVDFDKFSENLSIRISEANAKSTGEKSLGGQLGKKQRKSTYKRRFKCMGDYNAEKIKESLVDPTIPLFKKPDDILKRHEIIINNNNISHNERLGIIRGVGANQFSLTNIGKQYQSGLISYKDVFCNQMFLFGIVEDEGTLFPYRMGLKILMEVEKLNYIEFLYSIYSLDASENEEQAIKSALEKINYIRGEFPNVMLTSPANREKVREALNADHHIEFSERDVWTDRLTTGNQYRFFVNHMLQLDNIFEYDKKHKVIKITDEGKKLADRYLKQTGELLNQQDYMFGDSIWFK